MLGILLLLLVLLLTPAKMQLDYDNFEERFFWCLTWFRILLFSSEQNGRFQRKKKASKKSDTAKTAHQANRRQMFELFRGIVPILPKPLRWLWKGISVRGLVIGARVGCFDAQECAVAYGRTNAAIYTMLGLLESTMRMKVQQIQIDCAFGQERTHWLVRCRVQCCPRAVLAAAFSFGIGYVIKQNQNQNKKKAPAEETAEHGGGK